MEWVCLFASITVIFLVSWLVVSNEPPPPRATNYYNADKEVDALRYRYSPQSYQVELNKIIIQRQRIAEGLSSVKLQS